MHTSKSMHDTKYLASFSGKQGKEARDYSGQKEETEHLRVFAGKVGDLKIAASATFWMGRSSKSSVVYCSVWIYSPNHGPSYSGRGEAGGYGYHKASGALQEAFRAAGVVLWDKDEKEPIGQRLANIAGAGDSAMHEVLLAVARAAGWRGALEVL